MYADRPSAAVRQVLTDVFVVIWLYAWIRAAVRLHELVLGLAAPGRGLQSAGTGLADNLADAGGKVGRVPLVGEDLTGPFVRAADAARSLADAGRTQQDVVGDLALLLALLLLAVPVGLVAFGYLPSRLRWVRRAGAAAAIREHRSGRDLLALRALATRPLGELTQLGPDIAQAWRDADPAAVEALAALELADLGLLPSRRTADRAPSAGHDR